MLHTIHCGDHSIHDQPTDHEAVRSFQDDSGRPKDFTSSATYDPQAEDMAMSLQMVLEPETSIVAHGRRADPDLEPVVDAVLPLGQASAAYTGDAGRTHGRGKLVVAVIRDPS